ncbi:MAG TPA: response regulator, partial [Pyrinomonadaceae bacterium]|nr:response regulator [Pyrinomonadaceae bacterium]
NERPRRALVFADDAALLEKLNSVGYEARATTADEALRTVVEFAPDLLLIELGDSQSAPAGVDGLALAAQLRAAPATLALPLVLLYHADDAAQRQAAQRLGADDYFALAASSTELRARLEALCWRDEASRRTVALKAAAVSAEIDDFMRLLDSARADIETGAHGVLALVTADEAQAAAQDPATQERTLAAAHEFFKLNLRRLDLIAFYGPTLLLVYLPRKGPARASSTLARLRNEFVAAHADCRLRLGLATFPADSREIETLIECAEARLEPAEPVAATTHEAVVPAQAEAQASLLVGQFAPKTAQQPAAHESAEVVERRRARPVRESKQPDTLEAAVMPAAVGTRHGPAQALARAALEAAAHEREQRARGVPMPRRLLLTVSDAARMAQVNLLLRSAGYEVRAAFDAHQALNLLRIEHPDLLVLDFDLYGLDGLETLRRLAQQHHGRLPLPVVLFLPPQAQRAEVHGEARELGACGFVNLPYEPTALLDAVRTTGLAEEKE